MGEPSGSSSELHSEKDRFQLGKDELEKGWWDKSPDTSMGMSPCMVLPC